MFLHLGNDHMVEIKNIVAIFDIENASTSRITKEFLALAGKSKRVISCSYTNSILIRLSRLHGLMQILERQHMLMQSII